MSHFAIHDDTRKNLHPLPQICLLSSVLCCYCCCCCCGGGGGGGSRSHCFKMMHSLLCSAIASHFHTTYGIALSPLPLPLFLSRPISGSAFIGDESPAFPTIPPSPCFCIAPNRLSPPRCIIHPCAVVYSRVCCGGAAARRACDHARLQYAGRCFGSNSTCAGCTAPAPAHACSSL